MKRVPVSTRALVQRINRKLKSDGEVLKAARGERARQQMGDFYVIDRSRKALMRKDVDLEAFGRKLGALEPFEELKD